MQHVWLFSFSFVHGRNLHVHERMSVLQCASFPCIFTYLSYYLTLLLPPYLLRLLYYHFTMAPAVQAGARLLLVTAGKSPKSSGQIDGEG